MSYSQKLIALDHQRFVHGKTKISKAGFVTMSKEQRQALAARTEDKRTSLWQDLNESWRRQDEEARMLSAKHNIPLPEMKRRLQRLSGYGQRRAVNTWNAVVHVRSLEINENLPTGEKQKLCELQLAAKAENWQQLPAEQLQEMKSVLEAFRALKKKKGIRGQPKAQLADVKATIQHICEELRDLSARTGVAHCLMVVRTNPKHQYIVQCAMDKTSREFFEVILGLLVEDFLVKYEGYSLSRICGVTKNYNERLLLTRAWVRELLTKGLQKITGNLSVVMHYKRYNDLIVAEHGVMLEGWPCDKFDPSKMSLGDLERVWAAIENEECRWRPLSADELHEKRTVLSQKRNNGELETRKERCDKGKQRKPYKKRNESGSRGVLGKRMRQGQEEEEGNDEGDQGDTEEKEKAAGIISRRRIISSEFIEDSD